MEYPTPPSCALDEAERVESGETMTFRELGEALGYLDERFAYTTLERAENAMRRARGKLGHDE